jgi:hypothetical protein
MSNHGWSGHRAGAARDERKGSVLPAAAQPLYVRRVKKGSLMSDKVELIAEHYQKTFEVTLSTWESRNQTFLVLLATVGAATLLTFNVQEAQPLLVDLVSKFLSIEEATRKAELRTSFPYGLLQSVLLMVVMYLMLVLYHRTTFINRSYRYLEALEIEIRAGLSLSSESVGSPVRVAFTGKRGLFCRRRWAPRTLEHLVSCYLPFLACA